MLLLLAALSGGSCVSLEQAAPPVALLTSVVDNHHLANLSLGRDLYVTRCAKCHSVEPVTKYSREKWMQDILPDMAEESKLTANETAAVKAYVLAVLATPVTAVR